MSKIKFIVLLFLLGAVGAGMVYFILPPKLTLSFPTDKCLLTVSETIEEKLVGYEVRETTQIQNDEWELAYTKPKNNQQLFVMTLLWSERIKNETKKDAKPIELHFDSRKQKLEEVFSKEDAAGYLPALDMPLLIILQDNKIVGIEHANPEGNTPERKERAKRQAAGKSVPVQKFCFLNMDQIKTLLPQTRVRPQSTWNADIFLLTKWGELQIGVQCELVRFSSRDNCQVATVQYNGVLSRTLLPFIKSDINPGITQSFNLNLHGEFEIEVKSGLPVTHMVCAEMEHVYTALASLKNNESTTTAPEEKSLEKKNETDRTVAATIKETQILTWKPEKAISPK